MRLSQEEHLQVINNQCVLGITWCIMKDNDCKVHSLTYEDLLLDLDKNKYLLKTGIYYIYKVEHYYSIDRLIDTEKTIIVL